MRITQTPQGFLVVDQSGRPVAGPFPTIQDAVNGLRSLPPQPLPPAPGAPQPQQGPPPMQPGPGPQMGPAQAPPGVPPQSLAQATPPPPMPAPPAPPTGPQGPVMMPPGAEPQRPPASLASYHPDAATSARLGEMTKGATGPNMTPSTGPNDPRTSGPIRQGQEAPMPGQPPQVPGPTGDPNQDAQNLEKLMGPEKWAQVKQFIQSRMGGGGGQPAGAPPATPGATPPADLSAATKPAAPATMGLVPLRDYLEQKKSMGAGPGPSAAATVSSDEVPGHQNVPSDEVPNKPPTSLSGAYMQMAQAKKDPIDQMLERADKGQAPTPQDRPSYFSNPFKSKKAEPVKPKEKGIDQMTDDEIIQKILKEQAGGKKSSKSDEVPATAEA